MTAQRGPQFGFSLEALRPRTRESLGTYLHDTASGDVFEITGEPEFVHGGSRPYAPLMYAADVEYVVNNSGALDPQKTFVFDAFTRECREENLTPIPPDEAMDRFAYSLQPQA